jgi:hypothetical protein
MIRIHWAESERVQGYDGFAVCVSVMMRWCDDDAITCWRSARRSAATNACSFSRSTSRSNADISSTSPAAAPAAAPAVEVEAEAGAAVEAVGAADLLEADAAAAGADLDGLPGDEWRRAAEIQREREKNKKDQER